MWFVLRVAQLVPVRLHVRPVLLRTIFWERFVRLLVLPIWSPTELSAHLVWLCAVSVTRQLLCALSAMQEYTFTTIFASARVRLLLSPVTISVAVLLRTYFLLSL